MGSININPSGIRPSSQYHGALGQGLGTVCAVSAPGWSTSIPQTNFYTIAKTEAGVLGSGSSMYACFCDVIVTQTDSGSLSLNVSWNNGITSAGLNGQAVSLSSVGEQAALLGNFMCSEGSNVRFSTTLSGTSGSVLYSVNLRLVHLG